MQVCQRTNQGLVRLSNQDSLLATEHIYGVADGMGGHNGGETASRVAAEVIKNALSQKKPETRAAQMGVQAANRRIFEMAKHDASLRGMGTTLTFLWEDEQHVFIVHVGDSRAYRLRDGKLEQITEDHSVVAELLRNNVITAEMARKHPYRNVITRAVGVDPVVTADVRIEDKQENDVWLVCSDGLYNMVSDEQIQKALLENQTDEQAADSLMKQALDNGGVDNVSFVICRIAEVTDK